MKDSEHAVVVLCSWHLIEEAVHVESQQLALLTQHGPSVVQVPLVTHDHYGRFICTMAVFGGLDALNEPADVVEAGPVTDAVDQDVAISPPDLLMEEWWLPRKILWKSDIRVNAEVESEAHLLKYFTQVQKKKKKKKK